MDDRAVVLISVYANETPERLQTCLDSVVQQTRPPDKVVLVQDGPLGDDLLTVIVHFRAAMQDRLQVVPLPNNVGLAAALNAGLEHCDGEYVLRMDSDDISPPTRFERQLDYMREHPHVGVLGSAMIEFEGSADNPVRIKRVAEHHAEIAALLPWRNPMNHATCCYRTRLVRDAGGYPELLYLEDYFLWVKLCERGVEFRNLPEPLYECRFDRGTLQRRAGWINFRNECYLRGQIYRAGLCALPTLVLACAMQFVLRFAPLAVRERLWGVTRTRI